MPSSREALISMCIICPNLCAGWANPDLEVNITKRFTTKRQIVHTLQEGQPFGEVPSRSAKELAGGHLVAAGSRQACCPSLGAAKVGLTSGCQLQHARMTAAPPVGRCCVKEGPSPTSARRCRGGPTTRRSTDGTRRSSRRRSWRRTQSCRRPAALPLPTLTLSCWSSAIGANRAKEDHPFPERLDPGCSRCCRRVEIDGALIPSTVLCLGVCAMISTFTSTWCPEATAAGHVG